METYLVDEWLINPSLIVEHQKRNVVAQSPVAIYSRYNIHCIRQVW